MLRSSLKTLVTSIVILTSLASLAFGTIIVTDTTQANAGFAVSNTDLLQTHLASTSFVGAFSRCGEIGTPAFNDGIYGTQGNQCSGGEAATADGSNIATFVFDIGNGNGYNLTSIDTYAGWDNFRGGQDYNVFYDTVSNPGV